MSARQPPLPFYRDVPADEPCRIKLGGRRTEYAIVDFADLWWLDAHVWNVATSGKGTTRYARRTCPVTRRTIRMHDAILQPAPGYMADHVNGNGLDNRRSNLRPATKSQNAHNRVASAGHGVRFDKRRGKWLASPIKVEGVRHKGSSHATREEAMAARRAHERELLGDFAPRIAPTIRTGRKGREDGAA